MMKRRSTHRSTLRPLSAKHADWAFHANDEVVLDALAHGRHADSLREYFGVPAYAELTALAGAAGKAGKPRGPRILILPGIMGSKLGHRGRTPRVLWIDPLQIAAGRLAALTLPSAQPIKAMGVLLFSYAKLMLQLKIAGCDVRFHPYDWRLSLGDLGTQLAERIAAERRPVTLVAHSMGGLVARAAAKVLPKRLLRRIIMLGTPNQGSFAPVQALRGTYPFVRRMSTLDHRHTAEQLAQNVFCTFPGLYQMLPSPRRFKDIDLYDALSWPADGPMPSAVLLREAPAARSCLAAVDSRMFHIVGVNQETVVGLRRAAAGFEYAMDRNGDGTVPLSLARLPALKCYFVDEAHADLANNPRVIQAVLELVRRGRTAALPDRWRARPSPVRHIDDAQLRAEGNDKIDWRRLTPAQRETVFAALDSGRLLPAARHPIA
jgi:pimeloyl-ACP methyl ester carboxylesterase